MMNYKESSAYNYSLLSALVSSPKDAKAVIDGVVKSAGYFTLGTLIDHLTTSDEPYSTKFTIVSNKPSGGLLQLADEYYRLTSVHVPQTADDTKFYILQARKNVEYDSRLKDETVIDKFYKNCFDYVETLAIAKEEDKIIIDAETLEFGSNLSSAAHYDPTTGYFLNKSNFDAYFTQLELFGTINGCPCKGKPDIVAVKDAIKTIYLIDVKSYNQNFTSNFWRFHYYLQTPLYGELFKQAYPEYIDYTIEYLCLTIDTSGTNSPEIYQLPQVLVDWVLEKGEFIQEEKERYRRVPTIPNLLKQLNWHIENNQWDHSYDYYQTGRNIIN